MSQKIYDPISSVGVYYFNDIEQQIGYWLTMDRSDKKNFVHVCRFPINSPFQEALVEGVRAYILNQKP